MAKYIKLYNEFREFVKSSAKDITDEYEKRLINLILEHFDETVEAGTGHGRRGQLINNLIQTEGLTISASLENFEDVKDQKVFPFTNLLNLEVENFRGFSQKECFVFDKKYTFIYGPNGSGKSSLCEALEYAMLGYINEANTRRIETKEYIRNSFTGISKAPSLTGINSAGETVSVKSDPSLYNFCFIEKNRIEDFGRISANTPSDKQNLLATLFGLSEFNDYVDNFTKNIDRYVDTTGLKQQELLKKSDGVRIHSENLRKAKEQMPLLEKNKTEIQVNSELPLTFDQIKPYIYGSNSEEGRLKIIAELLSERIHEPIVSPSSLDFDQLFIDITNTVIAAQKLIDDYKSKSSRVRFRNLYTLVLELEQFSSNKCPVCETPIEKTAKDPFINSRVPLKIA